MGATDFEQIMEQQKLHTQGYQALNALHKTIPIILATSSYKLNSGAGKYLRQGVLDRYLTVEEDWRWIFFNIPPTRKHPLVARDGREACRHINSLYLHMQGILDNFAWLFLYQCAPQITSSISPTKVYLYSQQVIDLLPEGPEKSVILTLSTWFSEMKLKRHPIAHRLPLHIPAQILLSDKQLQERERLQKKYLEGQRIFFEKSAEDLSIDPQNLDAKAIDKRNRDVTERIEKFENEQNEIEVAMDSLGSFTPGFMYLENESFYPLYPDVAEDIHNLDLITNQCLILISKICA